MRVVIIVAALLSGCALQPELVAGNEASAIVMVSPLAGTQDAIDVADKHCQKFGKVAEYSQETPRGSMFRCVPK